MASHDLSVFLEEFGATVNLTLPGIVSEKERLLLKLLMEGMSVTEISQYRNLTVQKSQCKDNFTSKEAAV